MDPEEPEVDDAEVKRVAKRIRRIGFGAYIVFAVFVLITSGFRAFLGLTCSAAVTMIAFLWLEEIAE